jgi:hypothetical protein
VSICLYRYGQTEFGSRFGVYLSKVRDVGMKLCAGVAQVKLRRIQNALILGRRAGVDWEGGRVSEKAFARCRKVWRGK